MITVIHVNGKFEIIRKPCDENKRKMFFQVAKEIDNLMIILMNYLDNDFLFYWTDAIFFVGDKNIDDLIKLINKFGYDLKIKYLSAVKVTDNCIKVYDKNGDERLFFNK